MKANHSSYRSILFSLTFLIGFCTLLYLPSLSGEFVWDDHLFITQNDEIKHPENAGIFFAPLYWKDYHPGTKGRYRPLRPISLAFNYDLGKLNPYGYHLLNLGVHVLNCTLVSITAHLILRNPWGATAAGVLFACHPVQTEAVAWIKNRAELFALFFFLLSFLLVLGSERPYRRAIMRGSLFAFALVSYGFALMSKETAATLPPVLTLYGILLSPRAERQGIVMKSIPFWVITLLYIIFLHGGLKANGQAMGTGWASHPLVHLYVVGKTYLLYGATLFFPVNLNADRPFPIPVQVQTRSIVLLIAAAGFVLLLLLKLRKSSPVGAFSLLFILITLVPSSNLIPLEGRPFAEQRLYLPSVGFALLVAHLFRLTPIGGLRNRNALIKIALTSLLIISFSLLTWTRIAVWHDEQRLWEDVINKNPAPERGYYNLGLIYEKQGNSAAALKAFARVAEISPASFEAQNGLGTAYANLRQLDKALFHYRRALQLNPAYELAHYNVGNTLFKLGRYDEAIRAYGEAIRLKPDYADAYANLGWAYQKERMLDQALKTLQAALRLAPNHALATLNLGRVYYERGSMELAEQCTTRALSLDPDNGEAHFVLGNILMHQGRNDGARKEFEQVLRWNPDFAEAHNNLGNILQREGKPGEALQEYRGAIRLDGTYPEAHNNVANLYCLQKNFPEALQEYKKALSLRPNYFEAQFGLAGLFLMQGNFAQAEKEYRKAYAMSPEKVESALRRALDSNLEPTLAKEIKKILFSLTNT